MYVVVKKSDALCAMQRESINTISLSFVGCVENQTTRELFWDEKVWEKKPRNSSNSKISKPLIL